MMRCSIPVAGINPVTPAAVETLGNKGDAGGMPPMAAVRLGERGV